MMTVKINGKDYRAKEGATILEIARENGIYIPTLCFLEDVSDIGSCRLCMVEAEGFERMLPACRTKAVDGMVLTTESLVADIKEPAAAAPAVDPSMGGMY